MIVRPGSVVDPDWHCTEEGRAYSGALLRRAQRRSFGLIERPVLAPQAAADVVGYKVFVSGKSGVGKTALVAKLAGLEVPLGHHETTGIQTSLVYWPAKLRESGKVLFFRFSFWDCGEAVLRKFDHILPACREKADAVLFLFSFTDRASFLDLPHQISRVTDGTRDVVRMVVGTKFDQFAHTDVTESDMVAFSHTWGLPILRAKSVGERPSDGYAGLAEVAHLLNSLAEHLWRQDQVAAGLVLGEASPAIPGSCGSMKS
ncbi:ciliogenesis and planar polarity effector 2 [Pseudonaja textilis]|uniref:Ciliogenesis and planar polarity effector 2 n=1 Tax=Pseudonaja textilis TaxID=8673 RepID=A0A670ZVF8_PSETE|nr:ciliogenesis and planar polarity effector 2 [Pseudonaja textilis]